jgi:hypothetical protein
MKRARIGIALLVCMAFVACAGIQAKWNALTPDQKAQVIIGDLQGQLTNAFDQGKAYVAANPKYLDTWKTKAVPAFDQANKAIKAAIDLGKTKPLTPEYVYQTVQPRVVEAMSYLAAMGLIKK